MQTRSKHYVQTNGASKDISVFSNLIYLTIHLLNGVKLKLFNSVALKTVILTTEKSDDKFREVIYGLYLLIKQNGTFWNTNFNRFFKRSMI